MIKVEVEINVDPKALIEDYIDIAYKAMEELMMAAYHEWQDEAGRKLKTTRQAYRDAIQHKLVSPGEVELFLQQGSDSDHWIANALEGGHPPIDIRAAVLRKAVLHPERTKKMSREQRWAMISYLKAQGRWGQPPTPYTDRPIHTGGTRTPGRAGIVRRISKNTPNEKWQHPGFRPGGSGGLERPLRDAVVDFILKEAPEIFTRLFAKVSV